MKTIHLSILTGAGITITITMALILAIIPSSLADETGLTIWTDKSEYGIGEPISFFIEIASPLQDNIFPTAVIANEQNKTVWFDNDLPPNGYKGTTKVYGVLGDSERVPIINQTGKYTLSIIYGNTKASKDLTITDLINENNMLHFYGNYKGIDSENTTAEIANQTYYLIAIHKIPSDMVSPTDNTVKFHGVAFTFPGCGMCLPMPTVMNPPYYIRLQFPDQTSETLEIRANIWSTISPPMDSHEYFANGTKIFPNGTKGTWVPRLHKDPIVTVLSNHKNPQAGITVTHDSVKFLVSAEKNSNVDKGIVEPPLKQFKSGVALKDITCASDLQLIIKAKSRSPACVKPDTAQKLIERGWARNPLIKLPILSIQNQTRTTDYPNKQNSPSLSTILSSTVFPTTTMESFDGMSVKGYLTNRNGTDLANQEIMFYLNNATLDNGTTISENLLMGKTKTGQTGCFYFADWDANKSLQFHNEMFTPNPSGNGLNGDSDNVLVYINTVFAGTSNLQGSSNATKIMYHPIVVPIIREAGINTYLVNASSYFPHYSAIPLLEVERGKSYNFIVVSSWSESLNVQAFRLEIKNLPCGITVPTVYVSGLANKTQDVIPVKMTIDKSVPVGSFFPYVTVNNSVTEPLDLVVK